MHLVSRHKKEISQGKMKNIMQSTPIDLADVVAQAVGTVILHTDNDEFRHSVFETLKVLSSMEVEKAVKTRLIQTLEKKENSSIGTGNKEAPG